MTQTSPSETIYVVTFSDGTKSVVQTERPAGAHPESVMAKQNAIIKAEKDGKTVKDIVYVSHYAMKHTREAIFTSKESK